MPKKMRRAALRSALSVKASGKDIVVLDELTITEPKTSEMAKTLNHLVGEASVLVLIPAKTNEYEPVVRSINNLAETKTLQASYLNIRDLLAYDKLVLPVKALELLKAYLG
jgi:large subunit ribosomal protein L4